MLNHFPPFRGRYRRITPFDPASVTTISGRETDPTLVGVEISSIDEIWRAVETYYRFGLHPALGLCVRRGGKVIIDRTIGHARGNDPVWDGEPLVRATPDTPFNLFSASKSVIAMLIHLLDERKQIHIDDPVAEYIPEFGVKGKEHATIRHVLLHQSGVAKISLPAFDLDIFHRPDDIIRLISDAPAEQRAGRLVEYHAVTGGFILGEIVKRVTGMDAREFLERSITRPLGMSRFSFGIPERDLPLIARESYTGPHAGLLYDMTLRKALDIEMEDVIHLANDPRFLTSIVPAGNVVSTPHDACMFAELLLREGTLDGVKVFEPRTVRRAVAEQTYMEMDKLLLMPMRYSMGFMLGGQYASLYGVDTTHAFGHLGLTNILVYADPERDLSVALLNNGKPFVTLEMLGWLNISHTIARLMPRV